MSIGRFRGMVGALVWRPADGKYLILQRSEEKDFAAGVWECPTGRVDQGEGFTDAAYREVREELGVEVEIDFIVGTTHFYRGEEDPENEIIGVLFCCSLKDSAAIKRGWEHSQHRWITAQEAARLFPSDHWLGKTIRRAETIREMLSPALLAHYRTVGFDL